MNSQQQAVRVTTMEGVAVFDLGIHAAFDLGLDLAVKVHLQARFERAVSDPGVRALLFTSPPDALGVAEYRRFLRRLSPRQDGIDDGDLMAAREERALDQLILAVDACPKPTAIGLQGQVAGPFVGLSLAFDMRLAAAHTALELGTIDGVPPGGGLGFYLPMCLGLARARELTLSGTRLLAAQAHAMGLVSQVVSGTAGGDGFVAACIEATRDRVSPAAGTGPKPLMRAYTSEALEAYLEREARALRRAWRHQPLPPAEPRLPASVRRG